MQRSIRTSSELSHVENHVHGLTVCRASCRPGQHAITIIDPRNQWPSRTWSTCIPLVLDAIVQELEEGVDYAAKRHTSSGPLRRDLSSVQLHHPSSDLKLSRLSWSTDRQPISFMSRSFRLGDFQAPFQRRPDPRLPEHTDKVSLPNTPSRPRKGPSRRGCPG